MYSRYAQFNVAQVKTNSQYDLWDFSPVDESIFVHVTKCLATTDLGIEAVSIADIIHSYTKLEAIYVFLKHFSNNTVMHLQNYHLSNVKLQEPTSNGLTWQKTIKHLYCYISKGNIKLKVGNL